MPGATENHYRGEAGRVYQQQKRAVPPPAFPWVARLRAEKFQSHCRPTDTVLELGVGLGWNLAALNCARRIGTDLEDHLSPELKSSGVEFLPSTSILPIQSIDVVICHHVLEHVPNPPEMLVEARRLLRPEGKLLLHVPFENEARYRQFDPNEPNHHLYSWNAQTLGNLVAESGFAVTSVDVIPFGYDRAAATMALRLKLGESAFRLIRRLALMFKPACEVRLIARKNPGGASQ